MVITIKQLLLAGVYKVTRYQTFIEKVQFIVEHSERLHNYVVAYTEMDLSL